MQSQRVPDTQPHLLPIVNYKRVPQALRSCFAEHGFAQVKEVFSEREVKEIQNTIYYYITEILPELPEGKEVLKNGVENIPKLYCLEVNSLGIGNLVASSRLVGIASTALGVPVEPGLTSLRNALPRSRPVSAHQDAHGPNLDPPDSITLWLSLGDYGVEEGCMKYCSGSHKEGFQPSLYNPPKEIPFEMTDMPSQSGDVLMHHGLTIHGSNQNIRLPRRWALMINYYPIGAKKLPEREWLQKYLPEGYSVEDYVYYDN